MNGEDSSLRSEELCAICQESLQPNIGRPSICKHPFHYTCLRRWVESRRNCPICRKKITNILEIAQVEGEILREESILEGADESTGEEGAVENGNTSDNEDIVLLRQQQQRIRQRLVRRREMLFILELFNILLYFLVFILGILILLSTLRLIGY